MSRSSSSFFSGFQTEILHMVSETEETHKEFRKVVGSKGAEIRIGCLRTQSPALPLQQPDQFNARKTETHTPSFQCRQNQNSPSRYLFETHKRI